MKIHKKISDTVDKFERKRRKVYDLFFRYELPSSVILV
jgi:hypothetical protein